MIQAARLGPDDFGGPQYEGCNEYLNLTRPDLIKSIYEGYLQAGSDIIETNTFNATPLVLAEYDLADRALEIATASARMAKAAAAKFSTPEHPRFVAASMGPTTKTLSVTGGVTFETLVESFYIQAKGVLTGEVDLLLLETAQDTLNCKAALIGIRKAQKELGTNAPLMLSGTIEPMGTMLAGQNVEALYTSMEHANLFSIGLNCATGPEFMTDHLRTLSSLAGCFVSVYPNAGIPDEDLRYPETPESLAHKLERFVDEGWVNLIGGCCGTTPGHIAAIAKMVRGKRPRVPRGDRKLRVSGIDPYTIEEDNRPVVVGERTNVLGSRKFKGLITEGKYEEAAEVGREQVKSGAQILDVCLQDPDRDETADMSKFIDILVKKVKVPIMIDTTDAAVTEAALRRVQGKCLINSINLEDGEERFQRITPLIKTYGGAVIVGCIDEDKEKGMAVTRARKVEIAKRSFILLTEKYGVRPQNIIFDPLVFPAGTGDVNYIGSAGETIEGVRLIKEALPEAKTILGISNVSFGLPPAGREVLNSVFLYHCTQAGLDLAIVNSERLERYASIPEDERRLAEDLIYNRGDDPVGVFAARFKGVTKVRPAKETLPLLERLPRYIIEGSKEGLVEDLNECLRTMRPLEIINGPLMAGMDEVGRLFNNNELIVAEVLQSAEAMKTSVSHLEPFMEKTESASKGKILLATVKGDVHDIGKNLVEIILSNNGYRIVNLGIKVPPEELIKNTEKEKPDAIGLSGLLVKSAHQMVVTVQDLKAAGIDIPVLVGGAALTKRFTDSKIAPNYDGVVLYAKDAMNGLDLANQLADPERRARLVDKIRKDQKTAQSGVARPAESPSPASPGRSAVMRDVPLPKPPDFKRHILREVPLGAIFPYINPAMLYGKHLGLHGRLDQLLSEKNETAMKLHEQVESVKRAAVEQKILSARAVYQFFSCRSNGNDLLLLEPQGTGRVIETFSFPRQKGGEHLCLTDYCRDAQSGEDDTIALFVVTCGMGVRELSSRWKDSGQYLRSHILQALAIECAEGLAEWLHARIRTEWGIPDPPTMTIPEILKNKYRGIRVSFGYPACPNLTDQQKLFRVLDASAAVGVELTEGDMMDPEASVSALVFHHPEARYFRADEP